MSCSLSRWYVWSIGPIPYLSGCLLMVRTNNISFSFGRKIKGPETLLAAKQKFHSELHSTKDTNQSSLDYFLAVWMCSNITGIISLFDLLWASSKLAICSQQLGGHFHWTPRKNSSDFSWGIARPLANLDWYSQICILPFPVFMTCTWKSIHKRQLHY